MAIERKTITIDASGKILGRLATQIAAALIGKTNVGFQPHLDVGDKVVVTNVAKLQVTGKKMEQKVYHHHSGHPGGLKSKTLAALWEQSPAKVLEAAVSRMLPKNKHRTNRMKRLSIS